MTIVDGKDSEGSMEWPSIIAVSVLAVSVAGVAVTWIFNRRGDRRGDRAERRQQEDRMERTSNELVGLKERLGSLGLEVSKYGAELMELQKAQQRLEQRVGGHPSAPGEFDDIQKQLSVLRLSIEKLFENSIVPLREIIDRLPSVIEIVAPEGNKTAAEALLRRYMKELETMLRLTGLMIPNERVRFGSLMWLEQNPPPPRFRSDLEATLTSGTLDERERDCVRRILQQMERRGRADPHPRGGG